MQEINNTLVKIFDKLEDIQGEQVKLKLAQVKANGIQIRLEEKLQQEVQKADMIEQEIEPIKRHVEQVRGAAKVVGILIPLLIAIITYILAG